MPGLGKSGIVLIRDLSWSIGLSKVWEGRRGAYYCKWALSVQITPRAIGYSVFSRPLIPRFRQPINIRQNFRDAFVELGWNCLADLDHAVQRLGQRFFLDDWNSAFGGDLADPRGQWSFAFGEHDGSGHFCGVVFDRDGDFGGVGDDDIGILRLLHLPGAHQLSMRFAA